MSALFRFCLLSTFSLVSCAAGAATTLKGAGSTAGQPLYVALADVYAKAEPVVLAYQGTGSSDGLKQIKASTVDFGASDVALSPEQGKAANLICFPTVISGVVPIVNVAALHKTPLKLTGDVLADIYARVITNWNDPRLKALNPGVSLPDLAITVIARTEGSGTTFNFTDYLSKASPTWAKGYGHDYLIKWAAGVVTAKGSGGVVAAFKDTPGAIAYVDYQYVAQGNLTYALLKNHDGKFVPPNAASFSAALTNSAWTTEAKYEQLLTDRPGAASWPITAGTFVLVPQKTSHPAQTIAVLKFFSWAFVRGEATIGKADFVQLPENVQGRIFGALTTITDGAGQPLQWSLADALKLH